MSTESRNAFLQKLEEQKAGEVREHNRHAVAHANLQIEKCSETEFANVAKDFRKVQNLDVTQMAKFGPIKFI